MSGNEVIRERIIMKTEEVSEANRPAVVAVVLVVSVPALGYASPVLLAYVP